MKKGIQEMAKMVSLVIALVLVVNIFYVPEVAAVEPYTLMPITTDLTTSDGRMTVTLAITYQESSGTFISATIKRVGITTDVSNPAVEAPILSADKKSVSVYVGYNYTSWGSTHYVREVLTKTVP